MTPLQTQPQPPRRRSHTSSSTAHLSILLSLIIFTTTTTPMPTNAQIPVSRRRAAFTQYTNQFYIHGGILAVAGGTGDLSVLDLNSSWPTTNAAWTTLASGSWVWHHAMVPVKPEYSAGLGSASTKGFLLSVGGNPPPLNAFFSAYNLQTGSWTNLTTPSPYTGLEGHTAVADPATGLVYVMGGFYNAPKVGNLLTVFDPNTAAVMQRMEATDANNMTGGSAVWSTRRKTLLLFEGSRAVGTGDVKAIVQTAIREYDTTVGQWKTFETKGTFPSPRLDACAVESDDGSKVILFGGAADANVILNTIHILDVDSAQWTQGQSAPAARTQMACAYHSELFIAFGGTSNQTAGLYSNQPIVYDVSKDQWVEYYSPSTDGSTESSQKSNMGLIIGASVGVAVVCAVVLGYMVQKRRRVRKAVERDARTAALLSNGEDHYSDRRQTIHKKVSGAINSNSNDNNRVMAAAEHYAAKQTVGEPQALGSVEMGLQQSDRVPRSPHSTPDKKDESKTLLGGNTVGRDGDGSFTTAASAEKAISFVKRESPSSISPTSARRSPHTAIGAV